jgi:hypothetical protein
MLTHLRLVHCGRYTIGRVNHSWHRSRSLAQLASNACHFLRKRSRRCSKPPTYSFFNQPSIDSNWQESIFQGDNDLPGRTNGVDYSCSQRLKMLRLGTCPVGTLLRLRTEARKQDNERRQEASSNISKSGVPRC